MGEPGPLGRPGRGSADLVEDWRARLACRFPPAAGAPLVRAWAGLYDMTPDAHPIIGQVADGRLRGLRLLRARLHAGPGRRCGGRRRAARRDRPVDLTPYRLDRFAEGAGFPETLIL